MATNIIIEPTVYIGINGGVNDVSSGGTWTSTVNANASFLIRISATGTPDQFQWSMDNGSLSSSIPVDINGVGVPIMLANGLTVTFAASTGHGFADIWTIQVSTAPLLLGQLLRQRGFGGQGVALQNFMNETIHVARFGAKGDASTDDTAAIKAALNFAVLFKNGGANGGKVRLGSGVYMVSSTIVMPRGVQLIGETPYASVIRASSAFASSAWTSFVVSMPGEVFPAPAPQLFSSGLSDLTIDCGTAGYGYTPAAHISCLQITGTEEGTRLERLYLFNFTDYGLAVISSTFSAINFFGGDFWVIARSGASQFKGIFLGGADSRVHLFSITIASFSATSSIYPGITSFGCIVLALDHIHPEACAIGVYVIASAGVSISNVYGNPTTPIAVQIDPASFPAYNFATDYLIGDNVIDSLIEYVCIQSNVGHTPFGGPYTTGTVSVTNGSVNVVGSGTLWTVAMEDGLFTIGGVSYTVNVVSSSTTLTLTTVFTGTTASGQTYSISDLFWFVFTPSTNIQIHTVDAAAAPYALIDYRQSSINPSAPAWDISTAYLRLAQVLYSGVLYVSIQVGTNTGNQPDISPTWWIPGTPLFSAFDTYLDKSCITQPMGFKNRIGFGFDTFQDYPSTTIEVMGGAPALTNADVGIRFRRWISGSGYPGIGFPAAVGVGHSDMLVGMDNGTDDIIIGTYNNAFPAVMLRIKQSGGINVDNGPLTASGEFGVNGAAAQGAYASGGAVPTTTPTLAAFGFTLVQAQAILTLLNNIQAALTANGIMS